MSSGHHCIHNFLPYNVGGKGNDMSATPILICITDTNMFIKPFAPRIE